MSELNKFIIKICNDSWEEEFFRGVKNKDNCSGFVKPLQQSLTSLYRKLLRRTGSLRKFETTGEICANGKSRDVSEIYAIVRLRSSGALTMKTKKRRKGKI
jgi:hypothetical protein